MIMLVLVILEEDKKLILGIGLLQVLAEIWLDAYRLYDRCGCLGKHDIPRSLVSFFISLQFEHTF